MEITIRQQIYYSNKTPIPIREVAESLLALEELINQSPSVLEAIFPGTKIESIDVFINELKADSIWEDVIIKIVFGSQEQFDQFVSDLREKIGMDNIVNNPQLFSAILAVMILTGGAYLLGKDKQATPEEKATIEANNNVIINVGAGILELESDDLIAIIKGSIKDQEKLAKAAVRVVKPARLDPDASITFNDNNELRIESETIKAMPSFVSEPEQEEYIEDYESIDLEIRAIDLDSIKKGWAVVIPALGKNRIRLQLDPGIDAEELLEKRKFNANATIMFGYNKENDRIPKLVFLRGINKQ